MVSSLCGFSLVFSLGEPNMYIIRRFPPVLPKRTRLIFAGGLLATGVMGTVISDKLEEWYPPEKQEETPAGKP